MSHPGSSFLDLDKLVHCGIFVVFAILWLRVWPSRRRFVWVAWRASFWPRSPSSFSCCRSSAAMRALRDMLTDPLGVLIGIAVAPLARAIGSFARSSNLPGNHAAVAAGGTRGCRGPVDASGRSAKGGPR